MHSTLAAVSTSEFGSPATAGIGSPRALTTESQANSQEANADLDYRIVSTRSGFDNLASEWDALFDRAGNGAQLFQTFNWCWHWCNHYLSDADKKHSLAVVTGRRAGRLVLVWPLVVGRSSGLVQLLAMGQPVSQYSDALIEPSPEAQDQLRSALNFVVAATKPDLVWLSRVREDATIAPFMKTLGAIATRHQEAPYIDLSLTPDLDAYMERYSARARKKARASARRLAELGSVDYIEYQEGAPAAELAKVAVAMKTHQLSERGTISPAFADQRMENFFSNAALGQQHPAGVHVFALQCGGENAAVDLLISCKDRTATHIFSYDARFAKDNVGTQLLHHAIGRAIAEGYRTFDFLAPADEYKVRCADGTVGVVDWALPISIKGAAFVRLYHMMARPLLKKGWELLPAGLRCSLAQRYHSSS